jgi:hypothetical protein
MYYCNCCEVTKSVGYNYNLKEMVQTEVYGDGLCKHCNHYAFWKPAVDRKVSNEYDACGYGLDVIYTRDISDFILKGV